MAKEITSEEREEIRNLLREAAYYKAEMWDSLRGIEQILGEEVASDNQALDCLASEADVPAAWPPCDEERLDAFLGEVANGSN